MEGKVIRASEGRCAMDGLERAWIMGYVLHRVFLLRRVAKTRKHKRENFLFLCDAVGDFALRCFVKEAARL